LQKPSRLPKSRPLRFHKRDTLNKKHSSILLLRRLENIYRRLKKKRKKKEKEKETARSNNNKKGASGGNDRQKVQLCKKFPNKNSQKNKKRLYNFHYYLLPYHRFPSF
jgi:hypothetical protein